MRTRSSVTGRLVSPFGRKEAADAKREQLFDLPEIPKREERHAILLKERPDPKPEAEKSGKTFVLAFGGDARPPVHDGAEGIEDKNLDAGHRHRCLVASHHSFLQQRGL